MKTKFIMVEMAQEDCDFLEEMYGKEWVKRLEQHIRHEVMLRRRDEPLKLRKPWDY